MSTIGKKIVCWLTHEFANVDVNYAYANVDEALDV